MSSTFFAATTFFIFTASHSLSSHFSYDLQSECAPTSKFSTAHTKLWLNLQSVFLHVIFIPLVLTENKEIINLFFCFLFLFLLFILLLQKICDFVASFFEKNLFPFFKNLVLRTSIFEKFLRASPHVSPRWGEPLSDKRRSRAGDPRCSEQPLCGCVVLCPAYTYEIMQGGSPAPAMH